MFRFIRNLYIIPPDTSRLNKDQKAVCLCLAAILNLADDSNKDASLKPMLAEWTSEILSLSLSRLEELSRILQQKVA